MLDEERDGGKQVGIWWGAEDEWVRETRKPIRGENVLNTVEEAVRET